MEVTKELAKKASVVVETDVFVAFAKNDLTEEEVGVLSRWQKAITDEVYGVIDTYTNGLGLRTQRRLTETDEEVDIGDVQRPEEVATERVEGPA